MANMVQYRFGVSSNSSFCPRSLDCQTKNEAKHRRLAGDQILRDFPDPIETFTFAQ